MITQERILEELKTVLYPGFTKDIVTFNFIKDLRIEGSDVALTLDITSSAAEVAQILRDEITAKLSAAGANNIYLTINQPQMSRETSSRGKNMAPNIENFVMVSSGKGGVGKTTSSVNLAVSLAKLGRRVGLLDADVYGPNVPRMMGIADVKPEVVGNQVKPIEAHGVAVMSMGLLIDEGQSLIWRGAMIMKVIQQFLRDIAWGKLDILIIDMPPGTGDAQLTLAQSVPVTCGVVVTTPQMVAMDDTVRSIDMFEKLHIPIAGVIENMSGFICPESGKEYPIFGKGTAEAAAKAHGSSLLAQIPLEIITREGGDAGVPVSIAHPESVTAQRYLEAARALIAKIDEINKSGGVSNEAIQPMIGLNGEGSACSSGSVKQEHHHSCSCNH